MRLMIVDDHILFREGLAAILKSEPDIEIVGLGGTVQEAIEMARKMDPAIILMDFNLPDGTGVDATRAILANNPSCKIIFLTIYEEDANLLAGIRSGAKGYLLKNMLPSKLVAALRSVQLGESALSASMTLRLMEELARGPASERPSMNPLSKLTPRELDVLRELAGSATNEEISQQLFLSENTVKHHIHSIFEKLDLKDRKEAGKYAREHGFPRR